MHDDDLLDPYSDHIPDWASGINKDKEKLVGAQLFTRDGSRMGNAHIIEVYEVEYVGFSATMFKVVTDAGNICNLTANEIDRLFTVGNYVSDVARIKKHFIRPDPLPEPVEDSQRGTGRTTRIVVKLLEVCLRFPGTPVVMFDHGGPSKNSRAVMKQVADVLALLNVPHLINNDNCTITVFPLNK